jgi:hypothetical protein
MAGTGQEEWNHACDLCCYIYLDPESTDDDPRYREYFHTPHVQSSDCWGQCSFVPLLQRGSPWAIPTAMFWIARSVCGP